MHFCAKTVNKCTVLEPDANSLQSALESYIKTITDHIHDIVPSLVVSKTSFNEGPGKSHPSDTCQYMADEISFSG